MSERNKKRKARTARRNAKQAIKRGDRKGTGHGSHGQGAAHRGNGKGTTPAGNGSKAVKKQNDNGRRHPGKPNPSDYAGRLPEQNSTIAASTALVPVTVSHSDGTALCDGADYRRHTNAQLHQANIDNFDAFMASRSIQAHIGQASRRMGVHKQCQRDWAAIHNNAAGYT
jgi:hypothetical protein